MRCFQLNEYYGDETLYAKNHVHRVQVGRGAQISHLIFGSSSLKLSCWQENVRPCVKGRLSDDRSLRTSSISTIKDRLRLCLCFYLTSVCRLLLPRRFLPITSHHQVYAVILEQLRNMWILQLILPSRWCTSASYSEGTPLPVFLSGYNVAFL